MLIVWFRTFSRLLVLQEIESVVPPVELWILNTTTSSGCLTSHNAQLIRMCAEQVCWCFPMVYTSTGCTILVPQSGHTVILHPCFCIMMVCSTRSTPEPRVVILWKVRQYELCWKRKNRHLHWGKPFPIYVWLMQTRSAGVIVMLLMSAKKCKQNEIAYEICYCTAIFC